MGDNIVKIMIRSLPYNAASLTTLWHLKDPNHSVVSRLLCIITTTDIQTPVVMFSSVCYMFKYKVNVTSFLAFMGQISISLS